MFYEKRRRKGKRRRSKKKKKKKKKNAVGSASLQLDEKYFLYMDRYIRLLEQVATASAAVRVASILGAIYLRNNFPPTFLIPDSINRRRRAAAERTIGRGNMVDSYLDMSFQHTNDTQNSHDIAINATKKEIISRLRAEQSDQKLVDIKTIINALDNPDFSRGPDGMARLISKK